jgi:hypothetical protein
MKMSYKELDQFVASVKESTDKTDDLAWREIDLLIRSIGESLESDLGNRPEDDTYEEETV